MGIEALSRGAERAVLVERNRLAIRTIRENLERTASPAGPTCGAGRSPDAHGR